MQDHAADHLHVVMAHVQDAAAGFTDDGKRLRKEVVERLAVGEARTELGGLALQLLVAEGLDRRFEGVDTGDART